MYAVVEIQGKQYKAEEGALLKVDKLSGEKGDVVQFDTVLMLKDGDNSRIGQPYLKDAAVKGVVEEHGRDKKITVLKFKRRKNYSRKYGHRQSYSMLRVREITR